jgi:hypothetical protein
MPSSRLSLPAPPALPQFCAAAHYDNSPANVNNPDPKQEVVFGEQGDNEMFVPFLEVTVDDEDLRFERLQKHIR